MFSRLFRSPWLLAPDEPGSAAASGSSAPDTSGAASSISSGAASAAPPAVTPAAPPTQTPVSQAPVGGAAQSLGQAPAQQAAAAQQARTIRDSLRYYGLDYSSFPSDDAAIAHLAMQARRAQELQSQQQQFASQQQAQQQAQRPEPWFKAPEFDPRWVDALYRDTATGELRVRPGYGFGPEIAQKYEAFKRHEEDLRVRFAQDPMAVIKPGLEQFFQEQFARQFQQQQAAQQERQFAVQQLGANQAWMHERDQAGNPVVDPFTGRAKLSEYGQVYVQNVQALQQQGVNNSYIQHAFALQAAQLAQAVKELQAARASVAAPAAAAAAGNAQKDNFIQQAANRAGGVPPVGNNSVMTNNRTLSLQQRLQQSMQQAGVNPHDPVAN